MNPEENAIDIDDPSGKKLTLAIGQYLNVDDHIQGPISLEMFGRQRSRAVRVSQIVYPMAVVAIVVIAILVIRKFYTGR